MKCYSEKDGSKFQLCQKRLGYRTCFVQYGKGSCLILIQNIKHTCQCFNYNYSSAAKNETLFSILLSTMTLLSDGGIVRRGCSTKKYDIAANNKGHHPFFSPMFHVECENHVSGVKSEKFCYCSYHLCNYQKKISESIPLMLGLSLLVTALAS